MANIFVILFFISLIGLVIGLIKPSLVLHFLKGDKTRKKVALVFGAAILVSFVLIGVFTTEEIEVQLREEGIKLAITAEVTERSSIKVIATTNLPDGVTLMFSADDPEIFGKAQDTVSVRDGVAATELYTRGAEPGTYDVEVVFTPWQNIKEITDIVGLKGEYIRDIGVTEGIIRGPGGIGITIIKNSTSVVISPVPVIFDVSYLVGKNFNQIKIKLGEPSEYHPSLENDPHRLANAIYKRGEWQLDIFFNELTGEIIKFGCVKSGAFKQELLLGCNIKLDHPEYTVEIHRPWFEDGPEQIIDIVPK